MTSVSCVQAGGPLQSFYNAALYGGVPLPYNFPAAAATDTAIDPAAAVTAAVSAAAASLPADGATQVPIHLFGDVRIMWHQLAAMASTENVCITACHADV